MLTGLELMGCQNLAVPAEVMQHVVSVESSYNPYAIGVVGGQLVRQPQNLDEAVATVQMLDATGYNFSVGVAQVNRSNLGKYGLDSYEKAFEICPNLIAGSRILAECYTSSGRDWGKAFSCYYSGNFVTGYRDGYVQKIYASINKSAEAARGRGAVAAAPIPLIDTQTALPGITPKATPPADSSAYRVAIRSSALLDATTAAIVTAATAEPTHVPAPAATPQPAAPIPDASSTTAADTFVPQVRGPNDPPATPAAATQQQVAASPALAAPTTDHADLRQADLHEESSDASFVF